MTGEEFSKEGLKKSVRIVGQLQPVLAAEDGEILEGKHRLEIDPTWERKVIELRTKHRTIEKILIKMHVHYRRRRPRQETRSLLLALAKELEKIGFQKEKIASKIVELTPYSQPYILELLPEEYKQQKFSPTGYVNITSKEDDLFRSCPFPECKGLKFEGSFEERKGLWLQHYNKFHKPKKPSTRSHRKKEEIFKEMFQRCSFLTLLEFTVKKQKEFIECSQPLSCDECLERVKCEKVRATILEQFGYYLHFS